jgi:hypothetical protein
MPRLSEIRARTQIECCDHCREHGSVEVSPRIDFGADGKPCGPHFIPSDVAFVCTAASANAQALVGRTFAAREPIALDGPGWLDGEFVRDVC